ncbi:MAG: transposase [Thermoplasmata archaeon]|nr:transposase [Thermoplasmata archaeon]
MAHDVSRALMWLFTFSINIAQKNLKIPTRYNSIYTQKDVLRALTFLSLESEYAKGGLKRLTKRLRRANQPKKPFKKSRKPTPKPKKPKAPDSDTLLLRLKQISRPNAKNMLYNLNRQVLAAAKTKGAFRKKVIVAIDLTFIPYYGKMTSWVNGGKPKQGTSYFHVWATLRVVSPARRFTIKAIPIKRGCLDAASMAKTVSELLAEAKSLNLHVELVLLDKGFCWREVIAALKASGYKFLAAAKRDKQVKEAILDYFRTGKGEVRSFGKGKGEGRVTFNLTIHRFKKQRRKRIHNILMLYGAFATNLGFGEALRVWSRLPQYYRRRWGIETGYRVDGGFRAMTTSKNESLRFIYFQYMVFLENVWTLYNLGEAKRAGVAFEVVKVLSVTGKDFGEDYVHLLVATAFDRGPPWLTTLS